MFFLMQSSGCSSLLPREKNITVGLWNSYEQAQKTFDSITPYQTTIGDLKALNIDPEKNSNITVLNYADIASRFFSSYTFDGFVHDTGVSECIASKTECRGFELNEKVIKRRRYGNFFADILSFKRKTDIIGWEFNGIVLIKENLVIYKLTSGKPSIHEKIEQTKPLGPFQSGGIAVDIIKKNY